MMEQRLAGKNYRVGAIVPPSAAGAAAPPVHAASEGHGFQAASCLQTLDQGATFEGAAANCCRGRGIV